MESIPWVRCASGNAFFLSRTNAHCTLLTETKCCKGYYKTIAKQCTVSSCCSVPVKQPPKSKRQRDFHQQDIAMNPLSRAVEVVDATGIFTAWAYRPLTGYNRE